MRFNLSKESEVTSFKHRVEYLIEKGKKVELTEKRPIRSLSQNRYLHIVFSYFGLELGYTLEEVKQTIFKRIVCASDYVYQKKGIEFYKSTSSRNSLEMTNDIEKFRNWSSIEHGIYIPAPNEKEHLANLEEMISQYGNKQYS